VNSKAPVVVKQEDVSHEQQSGASKLKNEEPKELDLKEELNLVRLQKEEALERIQLLTEKHAKEKDALSSELRTKLEESNNAISEVQALQGSMKELQRAAQVYERKAAEKEKEAQLAARQVVVVEQERKGEAKRAQESSQQVVLLQNEVARLQAQLSTTARSQDPTPGAASAVSANLDKYKEETERFREEVMSLNLQLNAQTAAANALGALKSDLETSLKQTRDALQSKNLMVESLMEMQNQMKAQLEKQSADWAVEKQGFLEKIQGAEVLRVSLSEQLQACFAQNNAQRSDMEAQLQGAVAKNQALEGRVNELIEAKATAENMIADLEKDLEKKFGLEQAQLLEAKDTEMAQLQVRITELEKELKDKDEQHNSIKEGLSQVEDLQQQLEAEKGKAEEVVAKLTWTEQEKEQAVAAMEEQLEKAETHRKELEDRLTQAQNDLEAAEASAAVQKKSEEANIQTLKEELEKAESRWKEADEKLAEVQTGLEAAKASAAAAESQLAEMEAMKVKFEEDKKKIHEAFDQEKAQFIEEANTTLKLERKKSKAKMEKMKGNADEVDTIRAELKQKTEALKAQESKIEKLTSATDDALKQMEELQAQLKEQQDDLTAEREAHGRTQAELQVLKTSGEEEGGSTEEIEKLKAELAEMKNENNRANDELKKLKARHTQSEAERDAALADADLWKTEKVQLEEALSNLEKKVEANEQIQENMHLEHQERVKGLAEEVTHYQNLHKAVLADNGVHEHVENLEAQVGSLIKQKDALENQVNVCKNLIKTLKK